MAEPKDDLLEAIGRKAIFAIQGYDYDQDWSKVFGKFLSEKGEFTDDWVAAMQQRIYPSMLGKGQLEPWKEGDLEKGRTPRREIKERMDQMMVATGQKQRYNTMKESEYRPEFGAKKGEKFYAYKDPDKLYKIVTSFAKQFSKMEKGKMYNVGYQKDVKSGDATFVNPGIIGMGRFQIGLGEDKKGKYLAVYDKWDIQPTKWGPIGKYFARKAIPGFHMYDRYYYSGKKKKLEIRKLEEEWPPEAEYAPTRRKGKIEDMIMNLLKRSR